MKANLFIAVAAIGLLTSPYLLADSYNNQPRNAMVSGANGSTDNDHSNGMVQGSDGIQDPDANHNAQDISRDGETMGEED